MSKDNPDIKFNNSGLWKYEPVDEPLTKRERFAMAAMQGMLPEFKSDKSEIPHQSLIAEYAVHYADALLKELEQPND